MSAKAHKRKGGSAAAASTADVDDIPMSEKLRIINSTDVLRQTNPPVTTTAALTQAVAHTLPLVGFYLLMEMLVHNQFHESMETDQYVKKMAQLAPVLLAGAFIINRWVETRGMQLLLFIASILCGIRMMEIIAARSTYGQMLQVPGLGTIWIYAIAQLRLKPALIGLILVGLYHIVFTLPPLRESM
ncbi:hypothetical protein RI367_001229 [Sorochytrium milnesiophthora]